MIALRVAAALCFAGAALLGVAAFLTAAAGHEAALWLIAGALALGAGAVFTRLATPDRHPQHPPRR